MGKLSRYIAKEIALSTAAVTFILLLILVSNIFIGLLEQSNRGDLPLDLLFPMLLMAFIQFVTWLLPFGFFISTMLALGRIYNESEMVAANACGYGLLDQYKAVLMVISPLMVIAMALNFWVLPWANTTSNDLRAEAAGRAGLDGLAVGQFNQSDDGAYTLYFAQLDDAMMLNVFLKQKTDQGSAVEVAARGYIEADPMGRGRVMSLEQGTRYEFDVDGHLSSQMKFDKHATFIAEHTAAGAPSHKEETLSLQSLWQSDELLNQAQLNWRFNLVLSVLWLGLIAVPLSRLAPRQGRYSKLGYGVLLYIAYSQILLSNYTMVKKGEMSVWGSFWLFQLAIVLFIGWQILRYQHIPLWPRRGKTRIVDKKASS